MAVPHARHGRKAPAFDFSTDFHTRIHPLTSSPTPSLAITSATPIRTSPPRSNNHEVHSRTPLTISNYHAIIPCESMALSLSDDLVVSAPSLCPLRLRVILFRSFSFCFHTRTHSFAPSKTLSSIFSILSALFLQNTRGGVPRISKRSIRTQLPQGRNCHEISISKFHGPFVALFPSQRHRAPMPSALCRFAISALRPSPRSAEAKRSQ